MATSTTELWEYKDQNAWDEKDGLLITIQEKIKCIKQTERTFKRRALISSVD